jgi:NLR family CARD domain-containing protein 3
LDVGISDLTEEAALGIVRVERQRNKLFSLGLAECSIGPTGAKEIAEYVQFSKVLTQLDLRYNELNAMAEQALRDATKDRTGFQLLI